MPLRRRKSIDISAMVKDQVYTNNYIGQTFNSNLFDPLFKHSLWKVSSKNEAPIFIQSGMPGDSLSDFIESFASPEIFFSETSISWIDIAKPTHADLIYLENILSLDFEASSILASIISPSNSFSVKKFFPHHQRYCIVSATAFDPTPLTTCTSALATHLNEKEKSRVVPIEEESSFSLGAPIFEENTSTSSIVLRKLSDCRFSICALAVGKNSLITFRLTSLSYCDRLLKRLNAQYHSHYFCNLWISILPGSFRGFFLQYPQLGSCLYFACFDRLVKIYFSSVQNELDTFIKRFEICKLSSISKLLKISPNSKFIVPYGPNSHTLKRKQPQNPGLGEFWHLKRKLSHLKKYLSAHLDKFSSIGFSELTFPDGYLMFQRILDMEKMLGIALDEHCQISELKLVSSCTYRDALLKKLAAIVFISLPVSVITALFSMNIPLPWVYSDPSTISPLSFLYHYNYPASPFYYTLLIMLVLSLLNLLFLRNNGYLGDGWYFLF